MSFEEYVNYITHVLENNPHARDWEWTDDTGIVIDSFGQRVFAGGNAK